MFDFPIDSSLVEKLIDEQFPQWSGLPIAPIETMGHDNRTFHLGNHLLVRLPSDPGYVPHIPHETMFLSSMQPHLHFPIPECVGIGHSCIDFPAPWTVNRFIPGETLTLLFLSEAQKIQLADDLRCALMGIQELPTVNAPLAGKHCCYRGCSPAVYEAETYTMLTKWQKHLPAHELDLLWKASVSSPYHGAPIWFHGDVAPGNILLRFGKFYSLIDFGTCGTGDPACDYAMAWTYFSGESRKHFLHGLDAGMILRAKAWAMWKALISYDGSADSPHAATLSAILSDE